MQMSAPRVEKLASITAASPLNGRRRLEGAAPIVLESFLRESLLHSDGEGGRRSRVFLT